MKQIAVALVVILLAAGGATLLWMQQTSDAGQQARERSPSKVNVVNPRRMTVRDRIESVGTLRAPEAAEITTEVSGRIVTLDMVEGERVERGDLLVQLDDRQAQADLRVAQAQLEDARTKYDRASRLQSRNSISQSQVDELRTAVSVGEAQMAAAQVRIDNHRIEAPFAGVVGLRDVSVGAYLNVGDPITTLDVIDPMELAFSIPERFLGQVSKGQIVQAATAAFADESFKGELFRLGTRVSALNRSLPARALIANPEGRLRPGQFMSVSLTLRQRETLVIPEQAVLNRGDNQFVFIALDGEARRNKVELGSREPGIVEVVSGLAPEDAVVITGQDRLSVSDPVQVVANKERLIGDDWATPGEG